jgi:hypothetical protein
MNTTNNVEVPMNVFNTIYGVYTILTIFGILSNVLISIGFQHTLTSAQTTFYLYLICFYKIKFTYIKIYNKLNLCFFFVNNLIHQS